VFDELKRTLDSLFPAAADARVTHRWGGPLGIPRDYYSSVGFDKSAGTAWAGGYVGDGVSTTNLAGRTIADLVLGRDTEITHLPWVDHRSRKWEPEPLRWLGLNMGLQLAIRADRRENRTGRPSWQARALERLTGH
jgi:glycine/D-amino acid oxidase-like deaminating enzyme